MTAASCRLIGLGGALLAAVMAAKLTTAPLLAGPQLNPGPGPHIQCGGAHPCDSVARGFRAFHDRQLVGLGGNGRSCADCHMPEDSFQLSPAHVEARFQRLLARRLDDPDADDPLFRAIDADDFRVIGAAAQDFSNLRQNGLVRVTLPLPPTLRLIDPATNLPSNETFVDVWRMVPSVNDVRLTGDDGENPWPRGPNRTGGYQLDARQATLQDQALGALISHAEVQGLPAQSFLDDLAAFQLTLFTNPRLRQLADAIDAGVTPPPDPDPPLNALETQGKAVFARACAQCHGGPRQTTTPSNIVRYHAIATQCPRPVDPLGRWQFAACPPRLARNTRLYEVRQANGVTIRLPSSDPGRALLTGFVLGPSPFDDWNKFDVPAMRGIGRTAPYFHNNSANTLEDVVDHYIELFKFIEANVPPGLPPPPVASTDGVNFDRRPLPSERAALLAYLRKQ
jgi:cytochrome c peroxidase